MLGRRELLQVGAALFPAAVLASTGGEASGEAPSAGKDGRPPMKLGLVTYQMAATWDIPTIIRKCKATGFEGVELRTTHAHGVEPSIGSDRRKEVRALFGDSGITLWGLGTVCEFHSPDQAIVRQNVETCKAFVQLAEDVGAKGVKVRPNDLQQKQGVPVEKTLEQIGNALRECGQAAAEHGVEIWLEVHGGVSHPPYIRTIMDVCAHPAVGVCWNSNATDVKDGSVREYFMLLRKYLRSCHITELWNEQYPYRELFSLMKSTGYDRFTLAEIPGSPDDERIMRYYRALWRELCR
jgi:sugar phosphate isomerase/epimerase